MSPRRDRVVKARVSEAEQARWVEFAKESFEGNLSDAIRSAMERSIVETAEWTRQNRALGAQPFGNPIFASGISAATVPVRIEYVSTTSTNALPALPAGSLPELPAVDLSDVCPHGRNRESQWCPVCDREAA